MKGLIPTISKLIENDAPRAIVAKPGFAAQLASAVADLYFFGDFKPSRIAPLAGVRCQVDELPLAPRALGSLIVAKRLNLAADASLLVHTFHHLLREDGRLVLIEPYGRSLLRRNLEAWELTALLLNAGFRDVGQHVLGSAVLTHGRCQHLERGVDLEQQPKAAGHDRRQAHT